MWTRENGTWVRYNFEQTQRRFKEEYVEQILMYQKCVNAVTYTLVDNLEENIYNIYDNFTLDNWEEYHNTVKNHFTPGNIIDDQVNIIKADLASTTDIDITQEYINPVFDTEIVLDGHLVLLKDQVNTAENGVYKFENNKFEQLIVLENYDERLNFTVYIKLGDEHKGKQFVLERDILSLYPTDTDPKTFKEGKNYIIKHKFEYKNLNDITLHDGAIRKGETYSFTGLNVRHEKGFSSDITIENVPAGTLPNCSDKNVYITITGHTDPIFGFSPWLIENEVITPNGPNFDHTFTIGSSGIGAPTAYEAVDVTFESNVSFTVGEFGIMFKDYNDFTNGRTTELIKTGDKNRLRGVHMSSDSFKNFTDIVYTCGNNGTVLKSQDAGVTFERLVTGTNVNLHDINFYNTLTGIAVGERGSVLITETGGLNWIELQPEDVNDQKTLNAVFMNTIDQAIAIGDRGVFFTIDKIGNDWQMTKVPLVREENSLVSYSIINDLNDILWDDVNNYFYIAGSEGLILRIDTNFDLVFFEDSNVTFNFKCIDVSGSFFVLGGEDTRLITFVPVVSLNPDSNVSPLTLLGSTPAYPSGYEDDHVYNRLLVPIANAASGSTIGTIGIGNHTFYQKIEPGIWADVSATLLDDIKTRLLVLDYKLGRKMYFIDNNGEVVKPNSLRKTFLIGATFPGIDVLSMVNDDVLEFNSYQDDHNFWDYYVEHNLYDPLTATKVNDYTIKTVIAPYRYAADNIVQGGSTDVEVYEDHILLKLTNTALTLNPGDLIKVIIKETVPSFENFLEGTFMVISWDGTYARVNEIFNETLTNDLYGGVAPYTMEVINLSYIEEGNSADFEYCLNEGFFGFYSFNWDATNSVLAIEVADETLPKYFNMRFEIGAPIGFSTTYVLDFEDSDFNFKFGPYYSIMNVLGDLDPAFIPSKTFSMPQLSFTYESSSLSPNQFVFDGNKIVMGSSFQSDWEQYYENTFIDIVHNASDILTRVLILKKEEVVVNGLTRYYIYFDYLMQDLVSAFGIGSGDTIDLRSRNTLEQISYDLTRGDDVHHDIFPLLGTDNVNYRRYKEGLATFNTDNYAKILMQDSDIKEHVTGVMYTDKDFNLAFNVLNITNDPSFNYEPVDLYDMGVDEIPKRANAIVPNNVETFVALNTKTGRTISGIDFNEYAFRLVDGLNIVTLAEKYGWILETEMRDAVIGEDEDGLVWYKGDWLCGIWADGRWYSGSFYDGIWIQGEWYSRQVEDLGSSVIVKNLSSEQFSVWINGDWINGTWFNGTHFDGEWFDGVWQNGQWQNGQWDDGVWNNGDWRGGLWITGTWNDGTFSMENATSIWFFGYWFGGDFKNGLWKEGFFNQATGKLSRFGTESTYQLRSIWENGSFVNGEIHTFANVDNGDVTQPLLSDGYEFTVFNAGEIRSGTCYGATFKQGNWYGGNMLQGYVDAKIPIDVNNFVISGDTLTLDVQNYVHYIKPGDQIQIIGEVDPAFLPSPIKPTHEQIGYNTNPGSHEVQAVDFNNGNIDILLDSPSINEIDGTFGAYLNLSIVFTVHNGVWENSIWNGGLWLGGTWNGGIWIDGVWDDGKWGDESNPQP
jgi:hypothetical protein